MFVDLGDYRYLLMQRAGADPHTVSIVTSRSNVAGFIHITLVGEADVPEEVPTTTFDAKSDQVIPGTLIDDLVRHGFAVLGDVDFTSGSATLSENAMPSLDTIGGWLQQNPGSRIALVGHTDSVGDKAANQALSERRAQSVRARILQEFDVAPSRVEADGVGYLAPIAPNATSEGRALNRRVEVVLLTSE
jgi:OOP family OmpA-OmpF porin